MNPCPKGTETRAQVTFPCQSSKRRTLSLQASAPRLKKPSYTVKESLLSLLMLVVCQHEHGSGKIPQAVQLGLPSCSKGTIYINDTLHKGSGGADGAESHHLFSLMHSTSFPSNSTALIKISVSETHKSIL